GEKLRCCWEGFAQAMSGAGSRRLMANPEMRDKCADAMQQCAFPSPATGEGMLALHGIIRGGSAGAPLQVSGWQRRARSGSATAIDAFAAGAGHWYRH